MNKFDEIKALLDKELAQKNTIKNLYDYPDPLQVARKYGDEVISLACALFAYGNAKLIVKFLNSLNFELLNAKDDEIYSEILGQNLLYRFQNPKDVANIFITLKRLRDLDIQCIIKNGLENSGEMVFGIKNLIDEIYRLNDYRSQGYEFFWGSGFDKSPKSPYKRYNMYLRWMVRNSDIDMGLFDQISPKDLVLPLDTHTHKVSLKIGLCNRKSYDYKAAFEITQILRKFDPNDPIKYDFAIYRLGQSGEI